MDTKRILSSGTVNVSELLKSCNISPSKWADVKRGKSSFTPSEIEAIEKRIGELVAMSNNTTDDFLEFINQPEINTSRVLKENGIDTKTYNALMLVKDKSLDLILAMSSWQDKII